MFCQPVATADRYAPADFYVEPVGKVPDKFFTGDAQIMALENGSTIDFLMRGRGKVTPV